MPCSCTGFGVPRLFTAIFILDRDATVAGIGTVHSQVTSDGIKYIIPYRSGLLSTTMRNCCVTQQELQAAVSFTRHF